jgi:hypothetical protein
MSDLRLFLCSNVRHPYPRLLSCLGFPTAREDHALPPALPYWTGVKLFRIACEAGWTAAESWQARP